MNCFVINIKIIFIFLILAKSYKNQIQMIFIFFQFGKDLMEFIIVFISVYDISVISKGIIDVIKLIYIHIKY